MKATNRLLQYAYLTRLNKPIGILLLLWPTLWALWLASRGMPDIKILLIFILGTILMRSAGCAVNDFADRKVDGHVARTCQRPLATGAIQPWEALLLAAELGLGALLLVLMCNDLTIKLAFVGAALAFIYPFLKRITHLPQLGLGVAFSWGIPMAFAAVNNAVRTNAWLLFATAIIWPVIYDTMYAMADRTDDAKIGVKSTAILFGKHDVFILSILEIIFIIMLMIVGIAFKLHWLYFLTLPLVALLFYYQYELIKQHDSLQCIAAFRNNNWVGLIIFIGIVLGLIF